MLEVRNIKPENDATNQTIYANIEFDLVGLDSLTVDIDTLIVSIDTVSNIDAETYSTDYTVADISVIAYTGSSIAYHITVNPDRPFDFGQTVTVRVNVDDDLGTAMTEYSITFSTLYQDLISDFRYAFVNAAQAIPVYNEILMKDSTTAPVVFDSAIKNWIRLPKPRIQVNKVITTSGYSIDYESGLITFTEALDYNDVVDATYNFSYFTDQQINSFFKMATAQWNQYPPAGGTRTIYSTDSSTQCTIMIGAAMLAFQDLLFSLAFQEKRLIFDNHSWEDGWKQTISLFEKQQGFYKDMWEKLVEAKKLRLPTIGSVVVPSESLPGGRSVDFSGLIELENKQTANIDTMINMSMDGKSLRILTINKFGIPLYAPVSIIEIEKERKHIFNVDISYGRGNNFQLHSVGTSADHKYLTSLGMIRLKYLGNGSKIIVLDKNKMPVIGKIENISHIGYEKCYELEVPGYHQFACNGIIISNSRFFRYAFKNGSSGM